MNTPDRDASIDRLLSRSVRAGAVPEASERCLDAETLAAWVDKTLPESEAAMAEAHASECARCQETLAALVRVLPATSPPQSWWRRRWVLGSLVPLTAGAIALAIWVAAPSEVGRDLRERSDVQAQPAAPAPRQAPPSADRPQPPPAIEKQSAATDRQRGVKDEAPKIARRDQAAAKSAPPLSAPTGKVTGPGEADRLASGATPPPSPRAATAGAAPLGESVARSQLASAPAIEIASPDPSIRWRVGQAGSIQRSSNNGATWEALSSGVTEDLTAGTAPSATVCWVVGQGGTVLLTTDGREWRRLAFPERAALAAVKATDALTATVTIGDGRAFRTSDGGRTWTPLQEF